MDKKDYETAIFWYETAINTGSQFQGDNMQYKDFTPYICLGVCYYWLGNIEKAIYYNELAGKINPTDEMYLKNKAIYAEK